MVFIFRVVFGLICINIHILGINNMHKYVGHNYIGHNYIGHNYIDNDYVLSVHNITKTHGGALK